MLKNTRKNTSSRKKVKNLEKHKAVHAGAKPDHKHPSCYIFDPKTKVYLLRESTKRLNATYWQTEKQRTRKAINKKNNASPSDEYG